MPKARNPKRDTALELFIKSKGKVTSKEIAVKLDVSQDLVRKWKKTDRWEDKLRARGGAPAGNQNAKGAGAPERNKNAETHGAFSKIYLDELPEEQRELVERCGNMNTREQLVEELKLLLAKQCDLEEKIRKYDALINGDETGAAEMIQDKVIRTNNSNGESESAISVSAFHRNMALLEQQQKIHAKIIKVIDMLKSYELEQSRLDLDERRYCLARQKAVGEFDVDDDSFDGEADGVREKVL